MTTAFERAAAAVRPLDAAAMAEALARQDRLTKPRGALGRLEALSVQLAGIAGVCPPPVPAPSAVVVFAADHGVVAEGVTPWPQEVTAQMVANFVSGGAAINVLARAAGASVTVIDVGVATPLPPACDGAPGLLRHPLGPGTANLAATPAMDVATCRAALDLGAEVAADLVAGGAAILVTGGAAAGVPVVVDGLIADAALLAAERLAPGVAARCIAGHRSVEPGAAAVLGALGLLPVLDLDLRLGEGSGACLALPIVEAA